ncbi:MULTISPECIES: aromatic-ring-hydroxylating dioxygenase subunit beta [Paenarthrobacter]|jgi:3-phenylpropionate/cinnamic acid dioxygenase small subunit|uniref:Aromatic-ring hydroxylating dioxygenase beta-subunit n=1 Tax=Paenarthrobacter aurescens (strain TC1) TaxID=290340 RepID=A1RD09_PAEAT|nr:MULTISPECIES: aromatic-ring-hydroxylating dioxygenase subunit beta [Paenarthrobacter]ABM10310.1 Aromatic-ring hydroxylating dioxygenase beta-subunit [Paenarthrobacter aurescens TC1]MCY0975528.1 nuclear transport factor 2 family protein [Paenarthrobacter ureafaciens]
MIASISDVNKDKIFGIMQLQASYANCIDEDRLEEWPAYFLEKCNYMVTNAENYAAHMEAGVIWADSRAMLADRVSALREANIYESHSYRHILGIPQVRRLSESGGIHTETTFTVIRVTNGAQTELFATGKYVDLIEYADEQPMFSQRLVVCDSNTIDTLIAFPI